MTRARTTYHLRDGLCFERLPDETPVTSPTGVPVRGRVRIFLVLPGDVFRDGARELFSVVVDEFAWASVVASMSETGETRYTWMLARALHGTA